MARARRAARRRAAAAAAAKRRKAAARRRAAAAEKKRRELAARRRRALIAARERAQAQAANMERRYETSVPAGPASRESATQASVSPSHDDKLLLGGALALLAVAASSGLLLAQVARMQRHLGTR
jgi:hypothetical protein